MSEFVTVAVDGGLGVITLNRPQAINALSLEMIDAIAGALAGWRGDDAIRAVLLEGKGERGFCAGGDVRAVRAELLAGRVEEGLEFFAREYALNGTIATYPKPVIALTHGVVMGGGIGLAGHAGFRFTTLASRFAMPEGAIGFIPDVGVNFILAKAPVERALHVLMTGEELGPADALKLGLTDCVIANDRLGAVRERIVAASGAGDIELALTTIMQAEFVEPGEAQALVLADSLAEAYAQDGAENIVASLMEMGAVRPEARPVLKAMLKRCPTTLAALVESHCLSRKARDIAEVLARDLRLARYVAQRPDFAEGVRAALIDKDQRPLWQPAVLSEVDMEAIDHLASEPVAAAI